MRPSRKLFSRIVFYRRGAARRRCVGSGAALIILATMMVGVGPMGARAQTANDDIGALNEQVVLLYNEGQYVKATEIAKRALALAERQLGPDHPDVGRALNNLAELYDIQERYREAELLVKRALSIFERSLSLDDPDLVTALNNLAAIYRVQRRYGEAEPLFKRAFRIREEALGPEHVDVSTLLHNLAGLYGDQGGYGEAEPLYKRALTIRENTLGPVDPDVGSSLNGLAEVYDHQGRYGEAEQLINRALAIFEKTLGLVHPEVATSLNNLADVYQHRATVSGQDVRRIGSLDGVFANGASVDAVLAKVRELCPLPDTAYEIRCVSENSRPDSRQIRLGQDATKSAIQEMDANGTLARYRVVHFATHGPVSGDIESIT